MHKRVNYKSFILPLGFLLLLSAYGFKPPKNTYPKNDILYFKYGGDVDKMLREERKLDSLAHPYLYQSAKEEVKETTSGIDDESVILEKAEVMPQFQDGDKGLKEYIASGTAFIPDTLVGKKAIVTVKFYINTLGDAKNPKIIKSTDPSFDLQTIMLIDGMPKWTPAKQNGKEANCYITLPIKYGE
ncbi:MAG: energy transducer TonB [Chitinophagales bacterium]